MAGMFDDLIPAASATPNRGVLSPSGVVGVRVNAPQQQTQGMFDDLLPQQPQTQQAPQQANPAIQQHSKDGSERVIENVMRSSPLTAALSYILPPEMIAQGMTAGFGDEAMALIKSTLGQGAYDEVLAGYNQRLNKTREESPIASAAGEVTGALLTAPATPAIRAFQGANVASRAANAGITGGLYGGLYGAGSANPGVENRVNGMINGGLTGLLTGSIGAPLVEGLVAGTNALARPFRGMLNPEIEAQRRVATAIAADNPNVPNPSRVAADTIEAANAQNIPMVVADAGGDTTRALARSAANTSPPARTALNNAVNDRFETQGDRISDTVRAIVGGNPDAPAAREQLLSAARGINRPAYARAYAEGLNVWDDALEQLAQAPDMQTAIRAATIRGNNQAAVNGFEQIRNPFVFGPNGQVSLRVNQDGSFATPNLQFWDSVKQNLDKINTRESQFLARALRDHLDTIVPSYRTARAGASAAFGAQDALEAGQNFASAAMPIKEARIAYQRLNNAERELFAQGFASDLLDRIAKAGDRRNVINSIFQSADARQRLQLALGPQGAARLEAAARVENIMDMLRTAVQGNSNTARQLAELGLAGASNPLGAGVLGAGTGFMTGDWRYGGITFAALLSRRVAGRIDERVATRVGEMLASNDPQILRNAYNIIARNRGMMEAVRRAENDLFRLSAPANAQAIPQNVLPAAAEQDQNNRPR